MDFFKRLNELLWRANPFRQNGGLESASAARSKRRPHRELVVNRPSLSMDRYQINDNERQVDEVFGRMVGGLMELCDSLSMNARRGKDGQVVLREQGSTEDGRNYIFMKPMNQHGWLMEKSRTGWRISRAEKIVGQNLFLRSNEDPWDVATLWSDPTGERLMRISSSRFGRDLLSISEYERRLAEAIKELLVRGALH